METSVYDNVNEVEEPRIALNDFIKNAAYIARNTSVACSIIFDLVRDLKIDLIKEDNYDGMVENFLFQLKYMLHALEQDTNHLHQSMIEAGYKHYLYYQD